SGEHSLNVTGISTGPADESLQNRVITATSDNPSLIANPEVDYAGGPTGILRFTPATNGNGSAGITVTVTDNGGTAHRGVNTFSRTFTITVDPVNDAPVVNDATFAVNENAANGSVIGTVSASDIENDTITFAITGGDPNGAFAIDPDTGVISVADKTHL